MFKKFAWSTDTKAHWPEIGKSGGGDGDSSAGEVHTLGSAWPLRHEEPLDEHLKMSFPVEKVHFSGRTSFQTLHLIDTPHFGKCLLIDNITQSSESDEKVYHESMVHPAMLSHPCPKKVFIGGGGEGATLREVLRHKTVELCVMCDIDEKAVKLNEEILPSWSDGAFKSDRARVVFDDCVKYLDKCGEKFDVIIMDICDPLEGGPGWKCYTKEMIAKWKTDNLTDGGVFVTQSTAVNVNLILGTFSVINNTLTKTFSNVSPYVVDVPAFAAPWGYNLCSDSQIVSKTTDRNVIDKALKERLGQEAVDKLQHYDGESHTHMFNLPKFARQALEFEDRVYSLSTPIFAGGMAAKDTNP